MVACVFDFSRHLVNRLIWEQWRGDFRSNDMVISALSPWERILMHALWTMQIEMSFFLSFIHAAHEFQDLKTILQQQQEDVTTSLKNLRWLIKTRADALLYLRTTLGEECCDITQVAGTYGTPTRYA
ncbi:hypothetical protein P8452_76759 [Trifolium repens]|nr:hypothetical protein P8452_76759 [Trifolium repens]